VHSHPSSKSDQVKLLFESFQAEFSKLDMSGKSILPATTTEISAHLLHDDLDGQGVHYLCLNLACHTSLQIVSLQFAASEFSLLQHHLLRLC